MGTGPQAVIRNRIQQRSRKITDPAGRKVRILTEGQSTKLAYECRCKIHDIYIEALTIGIYPYRYIRNRESISIDEQLKLAKSRIAIVGAGGLGGHVILLLARLGVGYLIVVDPDVFDETNLNRQILCSETAINVSKSEQAVAVAGAVNRGVEVIAYQTGLNASNASTILAGADAIVDALDNLTDRFILEQAAKDMKTPLVHGALAGFEGQVMTIFPDDAGLRQLYGPEQKRPDKSGNPESVLGVPGITPSIIATFQAMEIVKIILKRGRVFRNVMLHVDMENGEINEFRMDNRDEIESE